MRLLIVRHAKAEKGAPGTRDRERPLAPRGFKDAPRLGAYMAHHELLPHHALVSPARRTRETWEGLASALPEPVPALFDDRLYESQPETILAAIRETERTVPTLLVLGHNPGLQDAARLLIAAGDVEARERLNERMPTCALAVIDFAGSDWEKLHPHGGRLERFVTPRTLKAATD
ncbi:MAG: histidine phosphatase family protein [Hyphomicrobiales bacterium]|nr:histidine phosphatase family protein [Hyphomicrobiales bacterium]